MSGNIIEFNEKSFDSATMKGNWVVDFWAPWCGPCKIMAPYFEASAKEFKGKVNFGKVNVDDEYELAQKFSIMSIPTILFIKDGEVIHSQVGAINKEQIIKLIDENF